MNPYSPNPLGKTLTKVFVMLVHGNSQAVICERLNKPRQRISEYTNRLERMGFIRKKDDFSKPIIYEATENVPACLWDKLPEGHNQTAGRDKLSKNKGTVPPVPPACPPDHMLNFHHTLLKVQVYQSGDLSFINKESWFREIRNNTRTLTGVIPSVTAYTCLEHLLCRAVYSPETGDHISKSDVNIRITESYKKGKQLTLLINPPHMLVTSDEALIWEHMAIEATKDIVTHLEESYGWQLGKIELTKQKPHFEMHDDALRGIADKVVVTSDSGKVFLSDSDGNAELGSTDPTLAKIIVEAPEKIQAIGQCVVDLSDRVCGLADNVESFSHQMSVFQNDLETFWSIYEMDAKRTKEAIRNDIEFKHFVMAKIGSNQQSEEQATASTDFGVMYL